MPCCPLCRNRASELIQTRLRFGVEGEVWKCGSCGFTFLWPRPTEAELEDYYADQYWKTRTPKSAFQRYMWSEWDTRQRIRRVYPLFAGFTKTNLLEIGAGTGRFLWEASRRTRGGKVIGVEPDVNSLRYIENLGITAYRELSLVPRVDFDLIVMFHVLEHVRKPVEFLRKVAKHLAPGGRIVVEIPNADDKMLFLKAYRERYFYQRAHLNYFSRKTLGSVFSRAELYANIRYLQRYNLKTHLRWMFRRKMGGDDGYYKDLMKSRISAAYADCLIDDGCSDTLWAVAEVN